MCVCVSAFVCERAADGLKEQYNNSGTDGGQSVGVGSVPLQGAGSPTHRNSQVLKVRHSSSSSRRTELNLDSGKLSMMERTWTF